MLFFGLSFLKPDDVNKYSYRSNDYKTLKPNDERVDNLFNYFEKNYISAESKFQPAILAEFSNSV